MSSVDDSLVEEVDEMMAEDSITSRKVQYSCTSIIRRCTLVIERGRSFFCGDVDEGQSRVDILMQPSHVESVV